MPRGQYERTEVHREIARKNGRISGVKRRGVPKSESTKEAMSRSMYQRWADDVYREHMSSPRPQHEEPSYDAMHGRAFRALRGEPCVLQGDDCSAGGHLEAAWLWHDTPWEFVRFGIYHKGSDTTVIRWWSIRTKDYVHMCSRHHKQYDAGGLLTLAYTRDLRRTA